MPGDLLFKPYTVELVTPAFPGGADPTDPETFDGVRDESVIYGLRFWFRALAGAILGTRSSASMDLIRRAEGYMFGSARFGFAARVSVAITSDLSNEGVPFPELAGPTLKYLGYGLYPTNDARWYRLGIDARSTFSFEVALRGRAGLATVKGTPLDLVDAAPGVSYPSVPNQELVFDLASRLASLWIQLGGVGARWRHGLGSMRDPATSPPSGWTADSFLQTLSTELETASQQMKEYLGAAFPELRFPAPDGEIPAYPVAAPQFLQLRLKAGLRDTPSALGKIVKLWRATRLNDEKNWKSSSRNADTYGDAVRATLEENREVEFAGLGLPIPFGFPNGAVGIPRRTNGVMTPVNSSDEGRRASPIWFRVVKLRDDDYGILSLLWISEYLPEHDAAGRRKVIIKKTSGAGPPVEPQEVTYNPNEASEWARKHLASFTPAPWNRTTDSPAPQPEPAAAVPQDKAPPNT